MTQDIASLYIKVDSKGVVTAGKNLDALKGKSNSSEKATESLNKQFTNQVSILKQLAVAYGAYKLASLLASQIKESTLLAARYETLGVVMHQVGNIAGYSAAQMDEFQKSLETTGISMVQSRNTLARMNQAQIDLTNATKLGRIAQDAAVIGNINSSEAFERLIYGIQSAQTEMLRTIGINVNFNNGYKDLAKTLDKNITELSELEKVQSRVNTVIKASSSITGSYEAAMGTAGKQMLSLERHVENLKVLLGKAFTPALAEIVEQITSGIKGVNEELSDDTAISDWGSNLRLDLLEIESLILRIQISMSDVGGVVKKLPLFDNIKQIKSELAAIKNFFVDSSEIETPTKELTTAEKALVAVLEKKKALLESMTPEAKAAAKAAQDAREAEIMAQQKAAKAAQDAADAADAEAEAVESAKSEYWDLMASIKPAVAETLEMEAAQKVLRTALEQGIIGASDYTRVWKEYTDAMQADNFPEPEDETEAILKAKIELYEDLAAYEAEYRQATLDLIELETKALGEAADSEAAASIKAKQRIADFDKAMHDQKMSQVDESLGQMGSAFQTIGNMYDESSGAYSKMQQAAQAMIVVQQTLAVVNAVAAIANQATSGDPYTAFERIAMMTSAMAGLLSAVGMSIGGGSSGSGGLLKSSSTVLGGTGGSESISSSHELLQDTYSMQLRELSGLNESMNDLNNNISGLAASILIDTDFGGYSGPLGLSLAKGLSLGGFSVGQLGSGEDILNKSYSIVLTGIASIGILTEDLSQAINDMLLSVYDNLAANLLELTTLFGTSMSQTLMYSFDSIDLDLAGMTGDEVSTILNEYFSKISDEAVNELFGSIISGYQQVGEGLYETAIRLVTDKAIIVDMLDKTGQAFTGTIPEIIEFSETIIAMAGDLDTLQDGFETFYSEFIPESEQFVNLQNDLTGALSDLNAILPDTRDGYTDLVQGLDLSTESGQRAYVTLLALSEQADSYYSSLEELASERFDLELELLEAQGSAEEALALARQDELNSMDESLRSIQEQIWATEDLNDAMSTYSTITEALAAAIDDISGNATVSTQAGFNTLYAQAMGGDTEALTALPAAAKTFLASAYSMSETELDYRRLESQVLNQLSQAADFSTSQVDIMAASIPGHATGLNRVPYDGYLMKAHKNEAVLTAPEAEVWRKSKTGNVASLEEFRGLKDELRGLREVTESGNYQLAKNTLKISKILSRFDDDGMPAERLV